MDNYQRFGLISGQVLMGLIFGFVGLIATAFFGTLFEEFTDTLSDLSTHIFQSLLGGYVGMQVGIGIDGYMLLKEKGMLRDFKRFFGQSILGLLLGLIIFYHQISLLSFFLPMIGALVGFNLGLLKRIIENNRINGLRSSPTSH